MKEACLRVFTTIVAISLRNAEANRFTDLLLGNLRLLEGTHHCKNGDISVIDNATLEPTCVHAHCDSMSSMCPGRKQDTVGAAACQKSLHVTSNDTKNTDAIRKEIYTTLRLKSHKTSGWNSNQRIGDISKGEFAWNQWTHTSTAVLSPQCDTSSSDYTCSDAYTQFALAFDDASCWHANDAIPILSNALTTTEQLARCRDAVVHMLRPKSCGAYVTQPREQLDAMLLRQPIITCGNSGYPTLKAGTLGGSGTWEWPWVFAEKTGACALSNEQSLSNNAISHTETLAMATLNLAISSFDLEGWRAVQHAAQLAALKSPPLYTPDPSIDCFANAAKYFAIGVESILHGTHTSVRHVATTRNELARKDPNLFCLASRYYERDNSWSPCNSEHASTVLKRVREAAGEPSYDVCAQQLTTLGITGIGLPPTDPACSTRCIASAPKPGYVAIVSLVVFAVIACFGFFFQIFIYCKYGTDPAQQKMDSQYKILGSRKVSRLFKV